MRTVELSTEVFAAIWAKRKTGEETEDEILKRVLSCLSEGQVKLSAKNEVGRGFNDFRNGVHFSEGFYIFRSYKGEDYVAIATNGKWKREDTSIFYSSLNQLNQSITAGTENVWNGNWKYRNKNNQVLSIASLRDS